MTGLQPRPTAPPYSVPCRSAPGDAKGVLNRSEELTRLGIVGGEGTGGAESLGCSRISAARRQGPAPELLQRGVLRIGPGALGEDALGVSDAVC